jgi:hypothetical protein
MTTRFSAFTVILENDIREDDAQLLISAIKQLRGVQDVVGHESNPMQQIAESRARNELLSQVVQLFNKN